MIKTISNRIHSFSKGWAALLCLIIFLLFVALVLPNQASEAEAVSGGAGSPDLSIYYSPDQLYDIAEAYGEDGRMAYVRARFTFDLIWPLVYMVFLGTAISWLSQRALAQECPLQRMNLLPLLAAAFDYLENVATSVVMLRYPDFTPILDVLAGVFTSAKWVTLMVSFLFLVVVAMLAILRWAQKRFRA